MELSRQLDKMNAVKLRNLTATLIEQLAERDAERSAHAALIAQRDAEIKAKQLKIDQLTHEMATLKRWRYDRRSEQLDVVQRSLLDESIDADIEAISLEIEALREKPATPPKEKPRRIALPASFPRREIRHEPEETQCGGGCTLERIGEDVSEKLDYTPGVFEVERHIRGKWVCRSCERLVQAPVPPHVIDKGIPTAALLAQVLLGSRTALPPGKHLRTCRLCAAALDASAVGGRLRREAPTAHRSDASDASDATGSACG
jgi:transposase